jgi:hypothetical protein
MLEFNLIYRYMPNYVGVMQHQTLTRSSPWPVSGDTCKCASKVGKQASNPVQGLSSAGWVLPFLEPVRSRGIVWCLTLFNTRRAN